MKQYNYLIPIILMLVLGLVVFFFVLTGRITFAHNEKTNYSFRNRFPHELFYQKNVEIVSYFRIFLIFLAGLCIAIPIFFATSFTGPSNLAFSFLVAFFFVAGSVVDFILFFLQPKHLKQFQFYATLAFAFMMIANGTLGTLLLSSLFTHFSYKIIAGVALVLAIFNLLMALNPKLKKWDRLEQSKNPDGTISYVRPQISPLAFSLWLNFLTLVLANILLLTTVLLIALNF
ncbi:MAG: hypothetical protein MJ208_00385 [Bacilli bacterium]|nr:hypothetical protein [Bacilli bacterium]